MNRTTIARSIATALLGTTLVATAVPALSHPTGEGGRGYGPRAGQLSEADREKMRERMQARMSERLDRLAARLDIQPSQQDAWSAYRKARESIIGTMPQRPGPDADAATITRFRAEMAQRRAQHLMTMADATAQLQQALEPDQRKVLDEISRRGGARGKRGGHYRGQHQGPGGSA